jgi:isoleucyl-tRNA synthetase
MDRHDLRERSREALHNATWIPRWGEARIDGMVENRPDWCISRQRRWGVPITVLTCGSCGSPAIDETVFDHIRKVFLEEGSDAWYVRDAADLVPPGFACSGCGGTAFEKEHDILDVWFESGVSHLAVCDTKRYGLDWPADLYVEGQDQYRGWFQSSLVASVGLKGAVPFREVLTHGFVVDAEGHKMSKSVGNVVTPQQLLKQYGADILRLWTAMVDYREDLRISDEIMARNAEAYRKIRNTLRFLLGNLADFDPSSDGVATEDLRGLDAYVLSATQRLEAEVKEAYRTYDLSTVAHRILNFCTVDLSGLYLDVSKDRLYCDHPDDPARRATQTVIFRAAESLARLLAPILSFTADEFWHHLPAERAISVHLATFGESDEAGNNEQTGEAMRRLLALRETVLASLEELRQEGAIGKSEEARVSFGGDTAALLGDLEVTAVELADFLIVSSVTVCENEGEGTETTAYKGLLVSVIPYDAHTCSRCWRRVESPVDDPEMPDLCERCHRVVSRLLAEGRAELGEKKS